MPRCRLRKLILPGVAIVTIFFFFLPNYREPKPVDSYLPLQPPVHPSQDHHQHHSARSAEDPSNVNVDNLRSVDRDSVRFINDQQLDASPKLWFMKDGLERPRPALTDPTTNRRLAQLWPHESDDDRIVDQLMFIPPVQSTQNDGEKLKKILLYSGIGNWRPLKLGRDTFLENECPVDSCEVTTDRNEADSADAILFTDHLSHTNIRDAGKRPWWQVWIIYLLECPFHTHSLLNKDVFNWTATYRLDSDIVTPYEKFVPYDKSKRVRLNPQRNYAANKTKKVAWFVSNCGAQNGRSAYAAALSKHIQVDIYGNCGKLQCPRNDQNRCFSMLNTDYKFYLSFENSNCKDYITEKFFVNGLGNDVIPIVLGASKEDYRRVAPSYSYIHVEDFESPKQLAEYLHLLDRNDTLYNEYFRWKGTGEFVNTYFWCRVCAMLHDDYAPKSYADINEWWRGSGTCVQTRWDQIQLTSSPVKQPK